MLCLSGSVSAHEWTPTYPKAKQSFIDGVSVVNMQLFNNRKDVRWFDFGVFDKSFEPVAHSTIGGAVQSIDYLERKNIDIYVRTKDLNKATYVCSKSKSISNSNNVTFIASRICSKIK